MPGSGEDLAAETFVTQQSDLLAIARAIVGQPETAEDLVQESWLRWQERRYPPEQAKPIFVRIIKNLAADWHRRRKVEERNNRVHAMLRSDALDTERVVIARQQVRCIAAALGEMPAKTVAAFRMSRLEGRTYEEIGQRLGTSKASAYRMVAQALVRIVIHLER
ncbi:MAG: sigma-70 family RNA polymerase sigma factor [Pseudomonadota bacterium]